MRGRMNELRPSKHSQVNQIEHFYGTRPIVNNKNTYTTVYYLRYLVLA